MNTKYDVVIPAVGSDIPFLVKVVKYIRVNLVDAEKIYIVTNERNFKKKALVRLVKENQVVVLDENNFVGGLSFEHVKYNLLQRNYYNSPGWFLQQFIKLGFATTQYANEYYLTWDADTLPLSKVEYFEDSHPRFTIKKECHLAYFETIKHLFGYGKLKEFSFIAEHMMFKVSIVREMLNAIENSDVEGEKWYDKCLNACNFNSRYSAPHFSEFETYGTYCMANYPEFYRFQKLNTFRSAGFIKGRFINDKILARMSLDLDTASFEIYDKPAFPYSIPYYVARYKAKYNKMKAMSLGDIIKKILSFWKK